jgi:hypothetical protein
LPIHLQSTLYQQEASFCAKAAEQWVPIPEMGYDYRGARFINGSANVRVEGGSFAATPSETKNSIVMASVASDVSFWSTIDAWTVQGQLESREKQYSDTGPEANE